VKCEKLVFEKEDVVAGLVELTVLHRVTRLVISAAADRQYSSFGFRKMDKPKSTKATEIMQRADPACKIWFICKGRLICTRGKEVDTAPSVTPLLPDFDHQNLQLVPYQKEVRDSYATASPDSEDNSELTVLISITTFV